MSKLMSCECECKCFTKWAPIKELCALSNYMQMPTLKNSVWGIPQQWGVWCFYPLVSVPIWRRGTCFLEESINYWVCEPLLILTSQWGPCPHHPIGGSSTEKVIHLGMYSLISEHRSHRVGQNWKPKTSNVECHLMMMWHHHVTISVPNRKILM